jgi:hypothetical protein
MSESPLLPPFDPFPTLLSGDDPIIRTCPSLTVPFRAARLLLYALGNLHGLLKHAEQLQSQQHVLFAWIYFWGALAHAEPLVNRLEGELVRLRTREGVRMGPFTEGSNTDIALRLVRSVNAALRASALSGILNDCVTKYPVDPAVKHPGYAAMIAVRCIVGQPYAHADFKTFGIEIVDKDLHERFQQCQASGGIDRLSRQANNFLDRVDLATLQARVISEFSDVANRYREMPVDPRLHLDDIDSFEKIRGVGTAAVDHLLSMSGYFDRSEESIQTAIEEILSETLHKKDWGGEVNDLYSSNVRVSGRRLPTAFALKGNGLKAKVLELGDWGKNGDQILRLFDSPARLFVVQYVGNIGECVIRDVEQKVQLKRATGDPAWYCVINGQDTARLLRAYGKA